MATLAGLTETGNAYTVTVTDASVDAAALVALDLKTSVAVVATAVSTLTGSLSDLDTAFTAGAAGTITGLGAEAVTVSDSGVIAAAELNTIDTATTGVVTVSGVTGLTGTVAAVNAAFAGNGVANRLAGLADTETATITDTTVAAADLITANAHTSGLATAQATTLTGNLADLTTVLDASAAGTAIAGLGAANITMAATGGALTAANVNTIAAKTTGVITATVTETTAAALATIAETGHNLTLTLADASVAATAISTIDPLTDGTFTVSSATVTGTAAEIIAAYALGTAGTVTGLGNEAITLSDTTLSAADP